MEWIQAKTMVTKTKSTDWFGTDFNMNIYKGCSHGCIYCDSRSDCYQIERFDEVRAKSECIPILRKELASKRKSGVIGTGAMSDPYNPMEATHKLTRQALEVIGDYEFGISIATKSDLVTRDIDLLKRIQKHSPVLVMITITCAEDALSKRVEPQAPLSSERFKALKALTDAGIYAGILLMPVLPFILDTRDNIGGIVEQAKQSGCRAIFPGFGVTLRQNQREWYYHQLDQRFPGVKEQYMNRYGDQYSCSARDAKGLYAYLVNECRTAGISVRMKDIIAGYKKGYENPQISMF